MNSNQSVRRTGGAIARLAEIVGALSFAIDMTEGQPPGHGVRCCWIGMKIADVLRLSRKDKWDLYYTLLLKDAGCSSNAARICKLYLHDDISFKHDAKYFDGSLSQALRFVLGHTGLKAGLAERFKAIVHVCKNGGEIATEIVDTRCERGAEIARQMRFSETVASGIKNLDEHWDGSGYPLRLSGPHIPLNSQIALLAQVADVFQTASGAEGARREIAKRSGTWFDPRLCEAFLDVSSGTEFWRDLCDPVLHRRVYDLEPALQATQIDDDYLDDIAAAFAQVVDAKSPFTAGHSERVTLYADLVAAQLGFDEERRRWLKRGALLHDIGKLGVSNTILDKPGKLDETEWHAIREHPKHTERILSLIDGFADMAEVAGAHHERLDGKGYPKRLGGEEIALEARVMMVADIFDALTAQRPYREAIPVSQALAIMQRDVGAAIDPDCFDALREVVAPVADTKAA